MITRTKSYPDYGLTNEEAKALLEYCRSSSFQHKDILRSSAIKSNPDISSSLYQSIVNGLSYEKLCGHKWIPLPKVDFYGYRRKTLAIFMEELKKNGDKIL